MAVPLAVTMPATAMKVLFEHPLISVWFHERRRVVHHRVNRPILAEELGVIQQAFNSGTEVVRKQRATKWLSDDRHQLVMPSEVQAWCQTVWFPATRSAGWKYWAIVQPESAVARLFVARLLPAVAKEGITASTFADVPEGLDWLDKFDVSVTPLHK